MTQKRDKKGILYSKDQSKGEFEEEWESEDH